MVRPYNFSNATQLAALERQKNQCGSCGTEIHALGEPGRGKHAFGERAEAHHMLHVKAGGTDTLDNCVVLCQSCHYSAHEGGTYRYGTVQAERSDFPFFEG